MTPTLLLLLHACKPDGPPPPPEPPPPVEAPKPAPELPDPKEPRLAATHLRIGWDGTGHADRSKDEAKALAERLHASVTPDTLEAAARASSDDPSGRRGGRLGVWATGVMDRDFERCVGATEVGAIGPLCETATGFHVLRRDPVVEVAGSVLVATFPPDDPAAAQAAHDRTAAALPRLRREDPGPVAAELGLELQRFGPTGPGQLLPAIDQALYALAPGAASEPLATPGAWVVAWRSPVEPPISR